MAELTKTYKAKIDIEFIYGDNQTRYIINSSSISYLSIISNYENQVIPIIVMNINVEDTLYDLMLKYKNDSKFYLSINKMNANSFLSLSHNTFKDYFSFIMSDTSPNPLKGLNEEQHKENAYRNLNIGLISYKMINNNRITFNGIYKDIDTSTLIYMALKGIQCNYEAIKYNINYDTVIVPPITTRYKFLHFIQNLDPFYDTTFKYFMDFDSAYLTSEEYNNSEKSVVINVQDISEFDLTNDGINNDSEDSYVLYIPSTQYKFNIDQYKEKVLDKIIGVDYDYNIFDEYDFDKDDLDEYDISKDIFVRSDSTSLIKNQIESSKVSVSIYKTNIDGSIFTPDRSIRIQHFDDKFKKYNGEYKLIDKKEILTNLGNTSGEFQMATIVTMKPVNKNMSKYIEPKFKK